MRSSHSRLLRLLLLLSLIAVTWAAGSLGTGTSAASAQSSALAPQFKPHATKGVTVRLLPHVSVSSCGTVSAYTAATAGSLGSITIGPMTYPIAANTTLTGIPVNVGDVDCLTAEVNVNGQITAGNVTTGVGAGLSVCGTVVSYTAAGATTTGLLTIGNQNVILAPGATLTGDPITAGSDLCLQASTNGLGQVTSGVVSANVAATLHICGTVTAYTPATATAAGSIQIAGQTFAIAPNTTLTGATITVGSPYCLDATTNTAGAITGGTVSLNSATSISLCGTVTAYTAATATGPGSITIGGHTYTIVGGATLTGDNTIVIGNVSCLTASVNPSGQITGGTVTVNAPTNVNACGTVTAYTPATATTAGSIQISGLTLTIAAGTVFSGQPITVGSDYCLYLTTDTSGTVTGGVVTLDQSATVTICGLVTVYATSTASTAGTITIGGQSFTIAPGVTISGSPITVGSTVGLTLTVNTPSVIVAGTATAACGATSTPVATDTATATVTGTPATSTATSTATATTVPATATATSTLTSPPPPPPTNTPAPTDTPTVAPTDTPTVAPTATPAPTALGAMPQLVARSSLKHTGKTALVKWHMAFQLGIKGFKVYSNNKNLSAKMIKPHRSPNYSTKVKWVKHSKYSLHVLLKNGHTRKVAIH